MCGFKHLATKKLFDGFTVGIHDDVTKLSLDFSEDLDSEDESVYRAKFYGIRADGTVGASKNNIVVADSGKYVQGFFVTTPRRRWGATCTTCVSRTSRAPTSCTPTSSPSTRAASSATSTRPRGRRDPAINTYTAAEDVFNNLPRLMQEKIIEKKLKVMLLTPSMAWVYISSGSTPESLKNAPCIVVLMRPAGPACLRCRRR